MAQVMTEGPKIEGVGERAERARRNRYSLTFAGLLLIGGILGAVLTALGPYGPGTLNPNVAIGATALYVIAMPLGSWLFMRDIDEVEMKANLVGSTWGLSAYVLVYSAWYMLWKGGLVSEPSHENLFLLTAIVTSIVYFAKKARP